MRERGCSPTTPLAQLRRLRRPRHPYAVPRTYLQCVCTRHRNCSGQLSPFSEYAPRTANFPARNFATKLIQRRSGRRTVVSVRHGTALPPLVQHRTVIRPRWNLPGGDKVSSGPSSATGSLGAPEAQEGPATTVLIHVNTSKQVGDSDHLKVFAPPPP